MLLALLITYLALPILIGGSFAARKWQSLRRPRLFLLGAIFEGYLAVAAVLAWALEPLTTMEVAGVAPGDPAAAGPLDGFERLLAGLPIVVIAHVFALWVTYRGAAKANTAQ